jgi:uncharacterized protein involved in cysteine biosynthesis
VNTTVLELCILIDALTKGILSNVVTTPFNKRVCPNVEKENTKRITDNVKIVLIVDILKRVNIDKTLK